MASLSNAPRLVSCSFFSSLGVHPAKRTMSVGANWFFSMYC